MNINNKMIAQNAARFSNSLLEHNQNRKDIERLAAALDYEDAAQLETDIEDFVTELLDMLKRRAEIDI